MHVRGGLERVRLLLLTEGGVEEALRRLEALPPDLDYLQSHTSSTSRIHTVRLLYCYNHSTVGRKG